jgi:hypothetical protein
MSKKDIKRAAKSLSLLEETKHRLRLQQEARTIARIEQLEIEACERLGRQLQLEHLELNGELDCSDTDTARQYTLYLRPPSVLRPTPFGLCAPHFPIGPPFCLLSFRK